MRYTVVWSPDAENDLAAIWLAAADRAAVTTAGDAIDAALKNDAHLQGESRRDPIRILIVPPLAVDVEVSEDDRTARVLTVWRTQ
jgi:plasmid stabilization system protein ParE